MKSKKLAFLRLTAVIVTLAALVGAAFFAVGCDKEHKHTYISEVIEPTCDEGGYTIHICSVCGENYVDGNTEKLGHNYVSRVTEPTCYEGGYTTHTCSRCQHSYTDNETSKLGHNYVSRVTEPTCYEGGYTTHTCSRCQHSYTDNETSKLGHNYVSRVTEPTCYEGGYTTHTCLRCQHSYTDNETSKLGHRFTDYRSDGNATFEADGTKTAACERGCGATDTVTDVGSRKIHSHVVFNTAKMNGKNAGITVVFEETSFDLSGEISTVGNAVFTVYSDLQMKNAVSGTVNLNVGDNVFYVKAQNIDEGEEIFILTVERLQNTRAPVTVRHNFETLSGEYLEDENLRDNFVGTIGEEVAAKLKTVAHFNPTAAEFKITVVEAEVNYIDVYYAREIYDVVFDGASGTLLSGTEKQKVKYGKNASAPEYGRKAYDFNGWSTDFTAVSENLNVTALWTPSLYTVNYMGIYGFTNDNPATYKITDGTIYLADVVTDDVYEFIGWTEGDSDVPQKSVELVCDDVKIKTFTAHYVNRTFNIEDNKIVGFTAAGSVVNGVLDLEKYTYLDDVTSIGEQAFTGNTAIKTVIIPKKVTSIGKKAFYGCTGITKVYYGGADLDEWNGVVLGSSVGNEFLRADKYYYSQTKPDKGNYWHYNTSGSAVEWNKNELPPDTF